jgi:hypothetical protein
MLDTIEKFDPENMMVAAGISFLFALELEIHLGGNFTPWTTNVSILYWTYGGLTRKERQISEFATKPT